MHVRWTLYHSATPLASIVSFQSYARKFGRPWAGMHVANASLNDGFTSDLSQWQLRFCTEHEVTTFQFSIDFPPGNPNCWRFRSWKLHVPKDCGCWCESWLCGCGNGSSFLCSGEWGLTQALHDRMAGGAWEQWALGFPQEPFLANPGGTYFTLNVKCLQILLPHKKKKNNSVDRICPGKNFASLKTDTCWIKDGLGTHWDLEEAQRLCVLLKREFHHW